MPEPISLSPHNAALLYLAQCAAQGLSPKTLTKYRDSINKFLREPLPATVGDLAPLHAVQWLATMRDAGTGPGGINTYQRAVWTWFNWLYQGDMMPIDIARRVKKVRVVNPQRRTASPEIHDRLIVTASMKRENTLRDLAIIELLWTSGIRRIECVGLQLGDLDLEAGRLYVRDAKGGKPREAAISAIARMRIIEYIAKKRGFESGPLFLARDGGSMSLSGFEKMFQRLAVKAEVEASPHDLRRAASAGMLRDGMAADDVARLLGHSVEMTLQYGEAGRTERAMKSFHERDAGIRPMRKAR